MRGGLKKSLCTPNKVFQFFLIVLMILSKKPQRARETLRSLEQREPKDEASSRRQKEMSGFYKICTFKQFYTVFS